MIETELSGLEPGQELDSLLATISLDVAMLGTPSITPGPMVPDPLDNSLDLLTSEAPSLADVAFLTFGTDAADHINDNGIFFSFEVMPLMPGTGQIEIAFVVATSFNDTDPSGQVDAHVMA